METKQQVTHSAATLNGKFMYKPKLFSLLLIVSLDSQTGSVHANLLMSGIFETDGEKNVPIEVKFSCQHQGETRDIIEHLTISKVDNVSL